MRRLPTLLIALILAPCAAFGQWSDAQREVVDNIKACWDIWVEALAEDTPDRWIDNCAEKDYQYWSAEDGTPRGVDEIRILWPSIRKTEEYWVSLRPVSIQLFDDIAVVHFYGAWSGIDGERRRLAEAKRTEIFRRSRGGWRLVAGHRTPIGDDYFQ